LNRYPLWKNLLVASVVVIGAFYAAPNLYLADPAVQLSADEAQVKLSEDVARRALAEIKRRGIAVKRVDQTRRGMLIRLTNSDD